MYTFKKSKTFVPLLIILFLLLLNNCSDRSEYGEEREYEKLGATDTTAPTIAEVTIVTTPTNDSTPDYTLSSDEAGTITFGGSCSSSTTSAISGNTTITLAALSDGTYSDCTITVTDNDSNVSDNLTMTSFTVDTTAATLTELTAVTTITLDSTPSYKFYSDTAGTITYGGSCTSSTTSAISGNNKITLTSLSDGTYSDCTITVTDTASNSVTLNMSPFTVDTGSGTINGSVISYSDSSALSGVRVSYALSGTTVEQTTTGSGGGFTGSSLVAGAYTLFYSKTGYEGEIQSATLATDSQTLTVAKLKMLSLSSCASAGKISGTITDAVSGSAVSGVSISIRRGLNITSGTAYNTAVTTSSGAYSISNVDRGWYTAQTSKTGYSDSTFHVVSCGNVSSQDSAISTTLTSGNMRVVLSWPTGSTAVDLDSHLQIPDNADSYKHIYYPPANNTFYYATNSNTCGTCTSSQLSDNVTLDRDETTSPGTETISVTTVRDGIYTYKVHDYTNRESSSISKLKNSGATVTVYYYGTTEITKTYNVPDTAGTLWTVFTFTNDGGLVEVGSMSYQTTPASVY